MMLPDINTVSAYQFTTEFESLNGIYTLVELITYNQALATGVNFMTSLYTPAGLTQANYTTDAPSYVNDTVLVLTSINNPTAPTLYVPQSVLALMPDSMVGCYNNVAIGVSLGLFNDQNAINVAISEINSVLEGLLGISNPAVIFSLGSQYMKVGDFDNLVAARVAAATGYNTLYEQLQAQIKLTQEAQALVADYQATLIALNAAP